MPIDTLKAAKRLQQEDTFSPEQAERIAEVLSELDVASATKEDLDEAESRLGERIDEVEARLDEVEARLGERIDEVETRLGERIDHVDAQMNERFERAEEARDALENRLTQRIELSEQRMEKQISQLRSDLYRALLVGFGAVAALVSVLNYVLG
jgi:exonuclease VII large subunit